MPKFCNRVTDTIYFDDAWNTDGAMCVPMDLAWEKSVTDSPLRKLILESLVRKIAKKGSFLGDVVRYGHPWEIVDDLLLYMGSKHDLSKLIKPTATRTGFKDRCVFHQHDEENPTCSETE